MAVSGGWKGFARLCASFGFLLLPILFFAGALYRAEALEHAYSVLRDCHFCFFWHALQHDCFILGLILVLSFFAFSIRLKVLLAYMARARFLTIRTARQTLYI